MADEKIIPSDDYRVKVATVVDMADKWFRQADGGELDKYDEIELLDACKSVLKFHGLTVVDPAKCMVLERREKGDTLERGRRYLIYAGPFDEFFVPAPFRNEGYVACDCVAFGPIQLPPTEGR